MTHGDWHQALVVAISILVITCQCALSLALPVVQVVANGVLFARGVLVKDGAALEKLARIDTIVLDKTGTLTTGKFEAVNLDEIEDETLALASSLTRNSTHPLSRALSAAALMRNITPRECRNIKEFPGQGLEGMCAGNKVRVGSKSWCGSENPDILTEPGLISSELWVAVAGKLPVKVSFADQLRKDAKQVVRGWVREGLAVTLLSGDRENAVSAVAHTASIETFVAGATPAQKVDYVTSLSAAGARVLMIGDGINDAPALSAADVSMAPASASDIGRSAADIIFLGDHLAPVQLARDIAGRSQALIQQNFALALLYNSVAIPVAIAGFASLMVAAIAMSTSSIVVILNALRLHLGTAKGLKT